MTREEMLTDINKIVNDETNQEKMKITPCCLAESGIFKSLSKYAGEIKYDLVK